MLWINKNWKTIFGIVVVISIFLMLTDHLLIVSSIILMWAPALYLWKIIKDMPDKK